MSKTVYVYIQNTKTEEVREWWFEDYVRANRAIQTINLPLWVVISIGTEKIVPVALPREELIDE